LEAARKKLETAEAEKTQLATDIAEAGVQHKAAIDAFELRIKTLQSLPAAAKAASSSSPPSSAPASSSSSAGIIKRSVVHYVAPVVPSARTRSAAMKLALENKAAALKSP
jgi:hypothetical protein